MTINLIENGNQQPTLDMLLGICRTREITTLAAKVDRILPEVYAHGREVASEETGLPLATFPEACPWTPEQVLTAPLEGPNSPFLAEPS